MASVRRMALRAGGALPCSRSDASQQAAYFAFRSTAWSACPMLPVLQNLLLYQSPNLAAQLIYEHGNEEKSRLQASLQMHENVQSSPCKSFRMANFTQALLVCCR